MLYLVCDDMIRMYRHLLCCHEKVMSGERNEQTQKSCLKLFKTSGAFMTLMNMISTYYAEGSCTYAVILLW